MTHADGRGWRVEVTQELSRPARAESCGKTRGHPEPDGRPLRHGSLSATTSWRPVGGGLTERQHPVRRTPQGGAAPRLPSVAPMDIRTQTVANPDATEQVRRATGPFRPTGTRRPRSRRTAAGRPAFAAASHWPPRWWQAPGRSASARSPGPPRADPAPSHAGWDGSVYWFVNEDGDWRYTSHEDVYLERTGGDDGDSGHVDNGSADSDDQTPADASDASDDDGIQQGWDGSVYWFKNSSGDVALHQPRGHLPRPDRSRIRVPDPDADPPVPASDGSDSPRPGSGDTEAAVEFALAQVGKPFEMGGNGPDDYDCSGLVQQAYLRAGISLPRIADDQYGATTPISSSDLQRGDLLYWSYDGAPGRDPPHRDLPRRQPVRRGGAPRHGRPDLPPEQRLLADPDRSSLRSL